MKRILIISPMPPLVGGVAVSSGRLFDNLKADGYDVDSYNIRLGGKFFNSPIGKAIRFWWIPFHILFHKKYDIIHCHVSGTWRKVYLSLMKPLCFKGAKLIYTLHGDISSLLNKKALFAMSKADRIICVQPGDSRKLPMHLQHKSVDIPAFILPSKITDEDVPSSVIQFAQNHTKPLVLFYGSVVINNEYHDLYGVENMVDLYGLLKAKGVEVQLLMLVHCRNKVENIHFMNQIRAKVGNNPDVMLVENTKMPMLPLFKYAAVYVRPTKTDGDSLAVREALSLGCPVIASDNAVRPKGTLVYTNEKELQELILSCLKGRMNVEEHPDFYRQIKNIYQEK